LPFSATAFRISTATLVLPKEHGAARTQFLFPRLIDFRSISVAFSW